MAKYFIIFNPAARGEKSQRLLRFLEEKARSSAVTLAPTQCAGDATRLAAEGAAAGHDVIVAAGGDGTINETVNGLAGTRMTLGLLPLGTVNVFARELGISLRLEEAWRVLETGTPRTVDLGVAEYGAQRRFFVQLAGIGLDARAVRMTSWKWKKRVGPLSYVWAGLKALREQTADVEVIAADIGVTARGAAVLIGNGRLYGGSFCLFPEARLDDGLLDVCVFEHGGYFHALRYGLGVLSNSHTRMYGVRYFRTGHFVCRAASLAPLELDGEDAGDAPVEFRVALKALRVIVPRV
jgi:YegS/Rv2252/BmrU family lipid kinase